MEIKDPPVKRVPVTTILVVLFAAFALLAIVAGAFYLDYQSGSQSSTVHPNGMSVSAITRGFAGGATGIGSVHEDGKPPSLLLRVNDREFVVTATEVRWQEETLAQIPAGTKSLEITSYRGTTSVTADGASLASMADAGGN